MLNYFFIKSELKLTHFWKNSTTNVRLADSIAGISAACMLSMAADYEMCDTAAAHPGLPAGPLEHMGTVGGFVPTFFWKNINTKFNPLIIGGVE